MPKNQRERGEKEKKISPEDREAFSRRYQVLLLLSWLKVTSGPKKRKDGSWNWLGHAKYAAWLLLDSPTDHDLELYKQEVMRE